MTFEAEILRPHDLAQIYTYLILQFMTGYHLLQQFQTILTANIFVCFKTALLLTLCVFNITTGANVEHFLHIVAFN